MTSIVTENRQDFLSKLRDLAEEKISSERSWFGRLQMAAWRHFEQLGFPTTKDEGWRYTNIKPITRTPFIIPIESHYKLVPADFDRLKFGDFGCPRIVFVNGRFGKGLSTVDELPRGVRIRSLADVLKENPESIRPHLAKHAGFVGRTFGALNLAFAQDGAVVEVSSGVTLDVPIHLLFVTAAESAVPVMAHPRVLVVAGDNSEAHVVESHLSLNGGRYLSNAVTELVGGKNARLDHYKLQHDSEEAFHIGAVQSHQERDSNVRTTTISLRGKIIRNETNSLLDGEGSYAELDGLYLVGQDHHVDNFTKIEHAKPQCDSRELYKGILNDWARGVFRGRIVVAEGAQKTDSKQTNRNLLLSDNARINTKPQLEIYADDVKCTHGATIGQLDKESIFYLRARGISRRAAESMLIYAFANELVSSIKVASLREQLDSYLFDWLPRGDVVRDAF
jgi:Fe-S cluster assembly protein SufD